MAQYTKDELAGQKRVKKMRKAGDRLAGEGENFNDLPRQERRGLREEYGVTHRGRGGNQTYNNKGRLVDIGDDNNPFDVKDLDDFDASAFGRGASRGKDQINSQDVIRLAEEGGWGAQEMADAFADKNLRGGARAWLERQGAEFSNDGGSDDGGNDPGGTTPKPDKPVKPPKPKPGKPSPGEGGGISIVNEQDNDNIQDMSNNSGTITNNQQIDNSISNNVNSSAWKDAWMKEHNFFGNN